MPTVSGEEQSRQAHNRGTGHGKPHDEEPRRLVLPHGVGQVGPEHVLHPVHEGEEPIGKERGRDADGTALEDHHEIPTTVSPGRAPSVRGS